MIQCGNVSVRCLYILDRLKSANCMSTRTCTILKCTRSRFSILSVDISISCKITFAISLGFRFIHKHIYRQDISIHHLTSFDLKIYTFVKRIDAAPKVFRTHRNLVMVEIDDMILQYSRRFPLYP